MFLENLVIDARDPQRLGRFWETALDMERLTDEPDIFEARLSLEGGPALDLCFPRVTDAPPVPPHGPVPRIHPDLHPVAPRGEEVDRLLDLGARPLDIGQGDVSWTVLSDPEGTPFCVLEQQPDYAGTGPLGALPIDCADPERDAAFWSWLTGWGMVEGRDPLSLRHPSGLGPYLEIWPERAPKGDTKNPMHLDVRLEAGDDPEAVVAGIAERGGREIHRPEWGPLPWRLFEDPSGNEFCVLPAQ